MVPARACEAAVLNEGRWHSGQRHELLELVGSQIARAQKADPAGVVKCLHGSPCLYVLGTQTPSTRGTVQKVSVELFHAQVLERTLEGLLHLNGERGPSVVGDSMILTRTVGELRLEKDVRPGRLSASEGAVQRAAYPLLVVVAPLVCGVYSPEPGRKGIENEVFRPSFFPGGAVEEGGNRDPSDADLSQLFRDVLAKKDVRTTSTFLPLQLGQGGAARVWSWIERTASNDLPHGWQW